MAPNDSSPNDNPMQNLAVYTNPNHDLKVVVTEVPEPKAGEVVVHVKATGICGRLTPLKANAVMFISGNTGELERR